MCCFSQPVRHVSNTEIFARLSGLGTQFLVYQMTFASDGPNAMVLPLPVRSVVRFLNFASYPRFFDDMRRGFPTGHAGMGGGGMGGLGGGMALPQTLPVESVGEFVASFVPRIADFDRLDSRFVLPKTVWEALPAYQDWGFAVFQLRTPSKAKARVHPMALEFDTRHPGTLFFPTLHIHDGAVHLEEDYDHMLYFQEPALRGKLVSLPDRSRHDSDGTLRTQRETLPVSSKQSAERFVAVPRTQGVVVSREPIQRVAISGHVKNQDIFMPRIR